MGKIAIIGAAGYVGQALVDEFNFLGITPTAITRSNGLFILSKKQVNYLNTEKAASADFKDKFDIIINLAYPTGSSYLDKAKNDSLINLITNIAHSKSKIIHTSSLAVFGYRLNHPVTTKPVKFRRDWEYVESKIYFENRLLQKFSKNELHIVRLGNVWGPGSQTWTVPIANNILYNQSTAIFNKDGFSNATDVKNVASYLHFLTQSPNKGEGYYIHHLAEFYDTKWSFWLNKFSELFKMPLVYVTQFENQDTTSIWGDIKNEMNYTSVNKFLKSLYKTKIAGSYLRTMVNFLPKTYFTKAEMTYFETQTGMHEQVENPVFFTIMSCSVPFENKTWKDWTPPVDREESWNNIENWIKEIKIDF